MTSNFHLFLHAVTLLFYTLHGEIPPHVDFPFWDWLNVYGLATLSWTWSRVVSHCQWNTTGRAEKNPKKTKVPDPLFPSAIFLPIWDKTLLGCALLQIMAGVPTLQKALQSLTLTRWPFPSPTQSLSHGNSTQQGILQIPLQRPTVSSSTAQDTLENRTVCCSKPARHLRMTVWHIF